MVVSCRVGLVRSRLGSTVCVCKSEPRKLNLEFLKIIGVRDSVHVFKLITDALEIIIVVVIVNYTVEQPQISLKTSLLFFIHL